MPNVANGSKPRPRLASLNYHRLWVARALERPERVFLVLATIFGVAMIFVMPFFAVPDEVAHFYRAYQVSSGHLVSQTVNGKTGGYVPKLPQLAGHYSTELKPSDIKFEPFANSATYSPVAYVPQAIGIDVARAAYPSIDSMLIAGRLLNLVVYIILIWAAIKIARQGKWVYAVAGLFPVALQEAASLSVDALTIGLDFVTIALIHRLFTQKTKISRPQIWGLIGLAIVLGLIKPTNIILFLPLLFLPRKLFVIHWRKYAFLAIAFLAAIIPTLLWLRMVEARHLMIAPPGVEHVNQAVQASFVLHHPVAFAKAVIKTYVYEGFRGVPTPDFFWASMYGYFSTFVYKLPNFFISLGYAVLLLALIYRPKEEAENKVRWSLAWIQLVVLIISLLAIAGALYLTWTPVGGPQISGMQGRYFIPLIPLLIPIFIIGSKYVRVVFDSPRRMGVIAAAVAIINLSATLLITHLYFISH